jgi:hypothetical protein
MTKAFQFRPDIPQVTKEPLLPPSQFPVGYRVVFSALLVRDSVMLRFRRRMKLLRARLFGGKSNANVLRGSLQLHLGCFSDFTVSELTLSERRKPIQRSRQPPA